MLNGPFVESNRAIISLEEDCPLALCFALEIIYSRFGEEPFELDRIFRALKKCTVFIAVGTSGVVEPAASLVAHVAGHGRALPGPGGASRAHDHRAPVDRRSAARVRRVR